MSRILSNRQLSFLIVLGSLSLLAIAGPIWAQAEGEPRPGDAPKSDQVDPADDQGASPAAKVLKFDDGGEAKIEGSLAARDPKIKRSKASRQLHKMQLKAGTHYKIELSTDVYSFSMPMQGRTPHTILNFDNGDDGVGARVVIKAVENDLLFITVVNSDRKPAKYILTAQKISDEELGRQRQLAPASKAMELAKDLVEQKKYAEALPLVKKALEIRRKILGADAGATALSLNGLGEILTFTGDHKGAADCFEKSLATRTKVYGEDHPYTALSHTQLGLSFHTLHQHDAARPHFESALAIRKKILGEEHPETAESFCNLGTILQEQKDFLAAAANYEQALKIYKKIHGPERPTTANVLNSLGYLHYSMKEYETARPYYEQALAIHKKVLGNGHTSTANSLNNLAALLQAQQKYEEARPFYEQALAINTKVLGDQHPTTANSLNNLGTLLLAQKNYFAARRYLEQALAIYRKTLGEQHPTTINVQRNLNAALSAQGDSPDVQ